MIGFALIFGAYTLSTFGQPRLEQPAGVASATAAPRVAIKVDDSDGNGIEDWRDTFVSTAPVMLDEMASSTYTPPDTITGKLGVQFIQDLIQSRTYGPFGRSEEEVIADTVTSLEEQTTNELYGVRDISIMETWEDADVRNYANAMAGAIERNDIAGLQGEIEILNDILNRDQTNRIEELKALVGVYERTRDDSLKVPVPKIFVKQHLDLINTYHAIYNDIAGMALSIEDPTVALLRMKRYEEDALGLRLALENMYFALESHAALFTSNDAALFFVAFSPNNQTQ